MKSSMHSKYLLYNNMYRYVCYQSVYVRKYVLVRSHKNDNNVNSDKKKGDFIYIF